MRQPRGEAAGPERYGEDCMAKITPPHNEGRKVLTWEENGYHHTVTFAYVNEVSQYSDDFLSTTGEVTITLAHAQYTRRSIHKEPHFKTVGRHRFCNCNCAKCLNGGCKCEGCVCGG